MRCHVCQVDKLSKEFTRENITDTCDHPPIHCLRCIMKDLSKNPVCPYKDCNAKVKDPAKVVESCKTELEQLYPPVKASAEVERLQQQSAESGASSTDKRIKVVMLTGDSVSLPYDPTMTVGDLKIKIRKECSVAEDKQQLMYNDCVLEEYVNGNIRRLSDYKIEASSTIHLMVLLYAIPPYFNHVTFDLFWGYPTGRKDYLDASCLIFSEKTNVYVVDYAHCEFTENSIWHSGDVMDEKKRQGHHTIDVRLKDIPSCVTHLFFTLSAWNSPTIAHYPNPSLKFFEASNKNKDLCSTTFEKASHSQAVIMCYVARCGSQWKIFECGTPSAGNANNYEPLVSTIHTLISKAM